LAFIVAPDAGLHLIAQYCLSVCGVLKAFDDVKYIVHSLSVGAWASITFIVYLNSTPDDVWALLHSLVCTALVR